MDGYFARGRLPSHLLFIGFDPEVFLFWGPFDLPLTGSHSTYAGLSF